MSEIKTYEKTILCEGCKTSMNVIVVVDEDGNEEYETLCPDCAIEYAVNEERDRLREEISANNLTWSQLVNQKNMDEKLGSRQYAKLEPAQKIFNTLIMTLGSDWLRESLNNEEMLKKLVDLSVELASRLVEKLYEGS